MFNIMLNWVDVWIYHTTHRLLYFFQVDSDAFINPLLPVLAIQVTSSLSLSHTACSKSLKATPSPVRSYMTGRLQEQKTASSLTVSTHSRSVDPTVQEQLNAFCSCTVSKLCQVWVYFTGQWSGGGWWRGGHHPDPFQICRGLHFQATGRPLRALCSQT